MMRILGIDPGLLCTGFGVVEAEGSQLQYVASGTIRTASAGSKLLPERLKILLEGLHEVIQTYQPNQSACEIVFVNVNPQATLMLGQARGACLAALVQAGLPVAEYTALQLKKAVTGYGKADKIQVQEMVKRLLNLPNHPSKDAADALGLCITHAQVTRMTQSIHQVTKLAGRPHASYKAGRPY